nr:PREDICTED: ras-interacting protein 1 [Latimeria chalumnae]|eukprot:XP_014351956.1 PREDICTED: ras-interacting protein 1 [Latimeria chalumnae]
MFSEDRKEGSPRFGKLHFPVGLWINSPKKHFAKLSRRWPSAGSVKSTSSDTASRSSETVELRPPTRNKNNRHKRISNIFHRGRWASEKKLSEIGDLKLEETAELSVQKTVPGILKIFGDEICSGANYKSVLATPRSTAHELVKEALERYAVGKSVAQHFVLCDVIGRFEGPDGGDWKMEYLRIVGDYERPLILQEMWKPKSGYARRFEIRRKQEVERMNAEQEDHETAGINAQARRLQKSRTRAASGGNQAPGERADSATLRRSISEVNLNPKKRKDRKYAKSMLMDESILVGAEGSMDEQLQESLRVEAELADTSGDQNCSDSGKMDLGNLERLSQSLILPPADLPYFLLLQGYNDRQDFVVYVMMGKRHLFGRGGKGVSMKGDRIDTFLTAPDILPHHCCIRQVDRQGQTSTTTTVIRPFRGASVTHNGSILRREAELLPGDLLGLGEHFLFMYKDPRAAQGRPVWLPNSGTQQGLSGAFSCQMCGRSLQERKEAFQAYMESRDLVLRYWPEEEEALLKEILNKSSPPDKDFKLGPAYFFSLCVVHCTNTLEPEHLPKLLLKIANLIKMTVCAKWYRRDGLHLNNQAEANRLGANLENYLANQQDKSHLSTLTIEEVTPDLQTLLFWMSNSMELLSFFQKKVVEMERDYKMAGVSHDPLLSSDLDTCEDAMAMLDEVIMFTFQQCVYYLTKALYSALPGLLDSNPFTASSNLANVEELSSMPAGVRHILAIYQATFDLTKEYELHPDLVSQMFGYLFFFSNASLFNTLIERGKCGKSSVRDQ